MCRVPESSRAPPGVLLLRTDGFCSEYLGSRFSSLSLFLNAAWQMGGWERGSLHSVLLVIRDSAVCGHGVSGARDRLDDGEVEQAGVRGQVDVLYVLHAGPADGARLEREAKSTVSRLCRPGGCRPAPAAGSAPMSCGRSDLWLSLPRSSS